MNKTSIEWTDYTWNPVTGCTKVSAGCRSCYAETIATRFWGERKFTDVQTHKDRLHEPFTNQNKWRGKRVFVCSMSDLFHEDVPTNFILSVLDKIRDCRETTFQILTKRPERFLKSIGIGLPSNLWLGVSVENQETANERIPLLLQIPAAVRFLSCEPLIGEVDLDYYLPIMEPNGGGAHVQWVIAGGESGHMARPMHPDWVRSLRDQCEAANVPFFFKQWGQWLPHCQVNPPRVLEVPYKVGDDLQAWYKVGKSKAGNTLDGKQHLEFPEFSNLKIFKS